MNSLKEKAYEYIREKIVTCEMMPGDIINEKALISQTGCGRTPVREALNVLERDGLVRIVPRRGMFVSEISVKDIYDMFVFKQEVEPLITRRSGSKIPEKDLLAFKEIFSTPLERQQYAKADSEFHALFLKACDNKYYQLIMNLISDQSFRVRILTNEDSTRIWESSQEHLAIIDALLEKDIERAACAMDKHYQNALENIMSFNSLGVFTID